MMRCSRQEIVWRELRGSTPRMHAGCRPERKRKPQTKKANATMTSPSLIFGAILLAFSPTFSLLFSIIFPKPQLVILAVCAAFAYLLSALLSSLVWLIITKATGDNILNSSIGTLLALSIPGVISQMILRCFFVLGYFKVEHVIRRSVAKHEEETLLATAASYPTTTTENDNVNGTSGGGGDGGEEGSVNNNNNDTHAETNALQLQLNDISCSLASGCGYAIMHSLFLYGTLMASESGEANSYNEGGGYAGGGGSTGHGGTLYQESCGESLLSLSCRHCNEYFEYYRIPLDPTAILLLCFYFCIVSFMSVRQVAYPAYSTVH